MALDMMLDKICLVYKWKLCGYTSPALLPSKENHPYMRDQLLLCIAYSAPLH